MLQSKSLLGSVKEYLLITLGIIIYVGGWIVFLIPNNMIGGGVTGISSIIQYATGIKIGYTYFAINAILLIIALKTLGKGFGRKSVFAIVLASFLLSACQDIIPADIIQKLAVDNGKLMCTIMGGIVSGCGIGMAISQGGSTGGTDIIALVINKYRNVSPGRIILWLDVAVILSSMLAPSYLPDGSLMPWTEKITTMVYGFILVTVVGTVIDLYLSGSRQSVQIFVFSRKYQEIADSVTKDLHRGLTVLEGKGWYSQEEVQVITIIARKTDLKMILNDINHIDKDAFISVSSVTGVYGKGFDTIKSSNKKNA